MFGKTALGKAFNVCRIIKNITEINNLSAGKMTVFCTKKEHLATVK